MRERTFVERRQAGWERLETLLGIVDRRGVRRLDAESLLELGLRYRATTSDLAAAQSRTYGPNLQRYLNRLTARAHANVYAARAGSGWSRIAGFVLRTFPREVRASWRPILACTVVTLIATIVAYWLVTMRSTNVYALLPAQIIPDIQKSLHDSNFNVDRDLSPLMSTEIITNNVRVAAIAFAGGMTLGVLTLWMILENGLMLGALGALFAQKGFGLDFWATIAPHGVIELSSIQIAGGAGLLLAGAIIVPGRLRRIDALKRNARRAGVLIVGVAMLLVIAGFIEGFISPLRTAIPFRLGVGTLTALGLLSYIAFAGRKA